VLEGHKPSRLEFTQVLTDSREALPRHGGNTLLTRKRIPVLGILVLRQAEQQELLAWLDAAQVPLPIRDAIDVPGPVTR